MASKVQLLVVCATFLVSQASPGPGGLLFTSSLGDPVLLTNDIQPGERGADRWWSPSRRGWPQSIVPWEGRVRRSAGVVVQDTSQTSSRYIQSLVRPGPSTLQAQASLVGSQQQMAAQTLPLQAASPLQQQGIMSPPQTLGRLQTNAMPNSSPLGVGFPGMMSPNGGMVGQNSGPPATSNDPRISGAPVGLAMGVDPRMIGAPGLVLGPPMGTMMNGPMAPMGVSPGMVPDLSRSPPGFTLQRDPGGNLWLVPVGGGMPRPLPVAFMQ